MELKAFHNEKDGQMYQNSDSSVDEFYVTWNFIYTGTPIALKKKVTPQNFGSGLSTRLAVIPMPKTNYEMIKFEEQTSIDWERLDRMKEWAYKLDARYGELPFWGLVKNLYSWMKCFGYNNRNVAYTKIKRLIDQNLATQITDGDDKGKYKKMSDMR